MGDEALMKQAIVDLARAQADAGAHYLWGGAGNRPGQSDGAQYRPSHVQLYPNVPDIEVPAKAGTFKGIPYVPTLFAAWVNSSDMGKLVCAGRCALDDVQQLDLALDIEVKVALDLKLKTLTQEQIDKFKENRQDATSYRWPRPNGGLDKSGHHSTVWGECCVGVRHFDCIGLVNYCFSDVLKRIWQYGIKNFTEASYAKSSGFTEVKPISSAESCDIVTHGSEHIGIVSNLHTAIEAMDSAHGVLERPLTAGGWTQCWRVPKSTWK